MHEIMKLIAEEFLLNEPTPEESLENIETKLNIKLPSDYILFLKEANGGEGFIGENYLILWKAEELGPYNHDYQVAEYAPGIFLFGSNGGGEAFGFDTRTHPYKIVQLPFVGMELKYAHCIADSFYELLDKMGSLDESLF